MKGGKLHIAILNCYVDYAQSLSNLLMSASAPDIIEVTLYHCPSSSLGEMVDNPPDVLVMEVDMPEIDGVSMCDVIRNTPKLQDLPIVLVSGDSRIGDLSLYFKGVDIVNKPVDEEKLLSKIKVYHSLRTMHNTLCKLLEV